MTLEEKFEDVIEDAITHDQQYDSFEQIAEDFAIGFAEFSINYNYHPMHKIWIKYNNVVNERFTTKQLLEIYKKTL